MEYLLMQNYPVPTESQENIEDMLRKYNCIIDDILHLENPQDIYLGRRDLGSFNSSNDLHRLFKTLS